MMMYAPLRMDTDDYLIELAWPEQEEEEQVDLDPRP